MVRIFWQKNGTRGLIPLGINFVREWIRKTAYKSLDPGREGHWSWGRQIYLHTISPDDGWVLIEFYSTLWHSACSSSTLHLNNECNLREFRIVGTHLANRFTSNKAGGLQPQWISVRSAGSLTTLVYVIRNIQLTLLLTLTSVCQESAEFRGKRRCYAFNTLQGTASGSRFWNYFCVTIRM